MQQDWDAAVVHFRQALQDNPDRAEYKVALERASLSAALFHQERARRADEQGDLETALVAYRKVYEYDPSNRVANLRAAAIDKELRERAEAARPRPAIDAMRETARQRSAPPLLDPASREPLDMKWQSSSSQDVLTFLGKATGINVTFESAFQPKQITVDLTGLTLEEGLAQVMSAAGTFYKVINPRTIMVIPDTQAKRVAYEEQVIRTFYLSHADATEIGTLLTQVFQIPQMTVPPRATVNKAQNSITVRASDRVMALIDQVVRNNDRPRAEILVDVQIIEINRTRLQQIGINLSQYQVGSIFSPEAPPSSESTSTAFNLNTITRGISTADFYLTVPQAVMNFLATDGNNRIVAKSQVRGSEGKPFSIDFGDRVPIPSTTFGGLSAGGVSTVPISSFTYETVGITLKFNNPRVTLEGEVVTELEVESSTMGASIEVAGQSLPTFGTRRVASAVRMREGESLLLGGLIREDQRRSLTGFPGLLRTPLLRRLFGNSRDEVANNDIVFLITPRLVRTSEVTQDHLDPLYIGTQQNLGLTGPPPLIAPPEPAAEQPAPEGAPQGAQPFSALPREPVTGPVTPTPGVLPAPQQRAPEVAPPVVPTPTMPAEAVTPARDSQAQAAPAVAAPIPPTARVSVAVPGPELQVGGGPYPLPISISGAQRVANLSLTVTYNPSVLRVRSVQAGPLMGQNGVTPTFTQQVDPGAGRVDLTLLRAGDRVGATGTGIVAILVVEAIAPGQSSITPAGVAFNPEQSSLGLQLVPASVTVK